MQKYKLEFPDNITVPALELISRAVPSVRDYHHRSVGPTTGRNPGGRHKFFFENKLRDYTITARILNDFNYLNGIEKNYLFFGID